jgi:hypothetical protein
VCLEMGGWGAGRRFAGPPWWVNQRTSVRGWDPEPFPETSATPSSSVPTLVPSLTCWPHPILLVLPPVLLLQPRPLALPLLLLIPPPMPWCPWPGRACPTGAGMALGAFVPFSSPKRKTIPDTPGISAKGSQVGVGDSFFWALGSRLFPVSPSWLFLPWGQIVTLSGGPGGNSRLGEIGSEKTPFPLFAVYTPEKSRFSHLGANSGHKSTAGPGPPAPSLLQPRGLAGWGWEQGA